MPDTHYFTPTLAACQRPGTTPKSSIVVVGLGRIGLPTSLFFAQHGHPVHGVDIDPEQVRRVRAADVRLGEPALDNLLGELVSRRAFTASTVPREADTFLIAVPTPCQTDHSPDLSAVEAAARALAPHLRRGNLVILESTVPVGTTERLARWMAKARPDLRFPGAGSGPIDVHVAHCPERVLPGRIAEELSGNDRVIGGLTPACAARARDLYRPLVRGACLVTDARTAEMTKLAENTFRDVNIALANQLATLCEKFGVDVWRMIELANRHPRVDILRPGPGVGGHCVAVDPWFLIHAAPDQSQTGLLRAARAINDARPGQVVDRVVRAARRLNAAEECVVACLGLAFKADVDDLRESPAVAVVRGLAVKSRRPILVVEPHIDRLDAELETVGARLVSLEEATRAADILCLLVDHRAFRKLDPRRLAGKTVIDTRGIWTPILGEEPPCGSS